MTSPEPGPETKTADGATRISIFGTGELGRLIREKDWSHTPLGPIDASPRSVAPTAPSPAGTDLSVGEQDVRPEERGGSSRSAVTWC